MRGADGGYFGRLARVDLSADKSFDQELDASYCRRYLGGSGFAARTLYDEVEGDVDPLGPENRLVFGVGPFQGTDVLGSGRWTVCAKSPLTGLWSDSTGGGHAPWYLKPAGFDGLVVGGRAESPVYLYVHDAGVEVRDASRIWGLDSFEATDAVREDVGRDVKVSTIGQAGENLVRFACVVNDKHGFAGRSGMGAVMGSKNLKAVAVEGTEDVPVSDPGALEDIKREWVEELKENPSVERNRVHGQARAVESREANGLLPMGNWTGDSWEHAEEIGAPRITEEFEIRPWPCEKCMMGCHRRLTKESLPDDLREGPGPEYETLAMLGSNLLIDDAETLVRANDLCNRYGIDTIEMGGILGLVYECYEEGLTSEADLGLRPEWGSGEALLRSIEMVKDREGFGSAMAEGIRVTAERLGGDAPARAAHVKGQSVAAHDPRAYFSMAVAAATSLRGACHLRGCPELEENGTPLPEAGLDEPNTDRFDWRQKGVVAAVAQDEMNVYDSLVTCFFYRSTGKLTVTQFADALDAVTGWGMEPSELMETGERITNLQRLFNLKMGQDPLLDDALPPRFEVPHDEGGAAGRTPPMDRMLRDYYEYRGWPGGVPSDEKLEELGLER